MDGSKEGDISSRGLKCRGDSRWTKMVLERVPGLRVDGVGQDVGQDVDGGVAHCRDGMR
jgi:hypothetical protein